MKLYATITGMRTVDGKKVKIKKSQGSNESIEIEVIDGNRKRIFAAILTQKQGYVDIYATTYEGSKSQEIDNCVPTKGEKQKGKKCSTDWCKNDSQSDDPKCPACARIANELE